MGKWKKIWLAVGPFLVVAALAFSVWGEEKNQASDDNCAKAKAEYSAAEADWSSANSEASFLHDELERLHNMRWNAKVVLDVLDDALEITQGSSELTAAQRMDLNTRIPNDVGTINPDGTLTVTFLGAAPLPMEEARQRLNHTLSQTDADIKKLDAELKDKEQDNYTARQRLAGLEERVEQECKATENPTPLEQGISRVADTDLYQRYADRERQRQGEVASRRPRYYYGTYPYSQGYHQRYFHSPPHGYSHGFGFQLFGPQPLYPDYSTQPTFYAKAMLIELKNANTNRTCRRCYQYQFDRERQIILDQLERSAQQQENLPCVGRLGAFRVLETFNDANQCYQRGY